MLQTHAPAKLNLYLHVTGRREDGYHLLDSLVTFASVGDRLSLEKANDFKLIMEGPMAAGLSGEDCEKNLAVRAARALGAEMGRRLDFQLTLTKNLPVASGIGGGSTDAAAALRLIAAYWGLAPDAPVLYRIAASLGQDIPCCIAATNCYFRGIGDVTEDAPDLPHADIVLVNPGRALPTPSVFKARSGAFQSAYRPLLVSPSNVAELAEWLADSQNGLSEAAISLCPAIATVLDELDAQEGVLLSRMMGSGATCMALCADRGAARQAAAKLYQAHPDWWVVPAFLPARTRVEEVSAIR